MNDAPDDAFGSELLALLLALADLPPDAPYVAEARPPRWIDDGDAGPGMHALAYLTAAPGGPPLPPVGPRGGMLLVWAPMAAGDAWSSAPGPGWRAELLAHVRGRIAARAARYAALLDRAPRGPAPVAVSPAGEDEAQIRSGIAIAVLMLASRGLGAEMPPGVTLCTPGADPIAEDPPGRWRARAHFEGLPARGPAEPLVVTLYGDEPGAPPSYAREQAAMLEALRDEVGRRIAELRGALASAEALSPSPRGAP